MDQILGQKFAIFEKMRYRSLLLLKLGAVEATTSYLLDQLYNKHTKLAVDLAIQYFEDHSQKKCLLKVWSFLVHAPQNGGPVKLLQNWTETIF